MQAAIIQFQQCCKQKVRWYTGTISVKSGDNFTVVYDDGNVLNNQQKSEMIVAFRSGTSATSSTSNTTTIPQNTTTTQNQQQETNALKPEQFEIFIQRAVYLKTQYDNTLPEGTSPLWWRKTDDDLSK